MTNSPSDGSVATIGVFDGVHRGHQALLAVARARADARGLPLVAVTFDPHPMSVVGPRVAPASLATIEQRVALLKAHGADDVDVVTFDEALSRESPEQFIGQVLVGDVRAREIVVGEDFRFGHRAAGSVTTLQEQGLDNDFAVLPVPLAGAEGQRWSSTYARQLIEAGEVNTARGVLGRDYSLVGSVVHGDHRGRELGFPTANLHWDGVPAIPADGVYAGWLETDGITYPAAISVGTNPHFAGTVRRVETYVLDRDDLDLYGHAITVRFVERIRGQMAFDDLSGLIDQMTSDVDIARRALESRD